MIAQARSACVLISGPAGIGKTALLEEVEGPAPVLRARGSELERSFAFGGVQQLFAHVKVPYSGAAAHAAGAFSAGGEPDHAILHGLYWLTAGLGPLAIVVDDAHWLDQPSLRWLAYMVNRVADLPLALIVAARSDEQDELLSRIALHPSTTVLSPKPLSRAAVAELAGSERAEAIHAATGGVPRLINQLGDQLVWMAEETGCAPLDATLVQQAWSDLQQLPAPWNTAEHAATTGTSGGVVEYGELDGSVSPIIGATGVGGTPSRRDRDDDADDEMPASIPIASGRMNRAVLDIEVEATIDATEQLLESFDRFDEFELHDEEPAAADPSDTPAATNPFDEPFDDEEIVLDPYAAFESELLRTAPQVINRLDRAFAGELHRCVQRAVGKPSAASAGSGVGGVALVEQLDLAPLTELAPVRLHHAAETAAVAATVAGELLIVEEDDGVAAAVIPGRQFRRLFSALESNSRSLSG